MIHGWSTTGEVWKDIAKKLSNDFHIIIPDNRGNGKSSIPTRGYHIKAYAKDIYNIIEKLNLKSPIFIGHSWGGNIGTLMGAEYPNLFNLIILEDPVYWKMIDGFKTIIPPLTSGICLITKSFLIFSTKIICPITNFSFFNH